MKPLAVFLAFAALLCARCASRDRQKPIETVQRTRDRTAVKSCVDLARVKTSFDDAAGELDLERQTSDLGGNVLLVYDGHEGGAFYCNDPLPPGVTISEPAFGPPPKP